MYPLIQTLCFLCLSVPSAPIPQVSQQAGNILYTHEILGKREHLLRLSAASWLLDSDDARTDRMTAFAEQFARDTCPNRFQIADAQRRSWPRTHPVYAKQFIFRCVG